ncbi:choloylglycine hydrolase family protein [Caproiciproducens sp. NJN-50]|uniref:linear amide C-N hydrolase n=1 Tax=Caproiciproducens sp. NJN-50 TaxID=2507162 RepID=UPI000FFE05E7|nr:choloylglycine hydrolase family protein [Caproiciproducens sp. NJN-50]QAT49593.1 choloylglycine hydrolase family protein [Caproiciproducens sp. NJN-50]
MCTAISLQSRQVVNFLGRTMDFPYPIEPKLYIVRRNYVWHNILNMNQFSDRYSFIGTGQESEGMMGFFDGINEEGFAAAALYFPGCAKYDLKAEGEKKQPIAAVDFLHYLLGKYGSVDELEEVPWQISLFGVPDPVTKTVAPLHWIAADRSGKSAVIEPTEQGLKLFLNPIGVLANSPGFQWQMTNLRNYMGVSPEQNSEVSWGEVPLKPFGQAGGTALLPGGYTSPERFVRTAYQKTHIQLPADDTETVVSCFHIMESVTVPKGAVMTDRGTFDYTKYIAFMNTKTCEYFFKTYDNSEIAVASLWDNYENGKQPICLGDLTRPAFFRKIS